MESLTGEQMVTLLNGLQDHWLYPIAALALGSGMRRGEILGLQWTDVDLDGATVRVERSVEETNDGLRFKEPKTSYGNRLVSLPATSVDALKAHWRKQSELRLALGQGRHSPDSLVFCKIDGSPMSPDNLSRDWRAVTDLRKLPRVRFHDLRHAHASALIASGQDVLSVSRRLGHGSPVITLSVYAHQFHKTDDAAAAAIEAALRTGQKR